MWDKTHYNINEYKIIFYEKENGQIPFMVFYKSLDTRMQIKVIKALDILSNYGNNIPRNYSKKLDKYIYELRIIERNNISRVFYFFIKNKKIVITNGFIKKTNKTPKNELTKARLYRLDWLRRTHDI